jgi:hypothetical protein
MPSFEKNASLILREAVEEIAPGVIDAEVVSEHLTERQDKRIRLHVGRKVFGRKFRGNADLDRYIDKGDYAEKSAKQYRLSQELLPVDGIGDDSFFLNEYYADEGPRLSGFETMRAWDEYTHDRQEEFAAEEGQRPNGAEPYDGRLLWDWGRWLDGGRLVYGNLSVAIWHLTAALGDYAGDMAGERYKTEWIEGPEHMKKTSGGYRWDMIETPPLNGALRFAADHAARVVIKFWAEGPYKEQIRASGTWVSRIRKEEDGEICEDVVFSGVEAMDRARFRHWLADLAALPDGNAIYANIVAVEEERIRDLMRVVFTELDKAADLVGEVGKDNWRDLYNIAMPAVIASYPRLEGITFEPEKIREG